MAIKPSVNTQPPFIIKIQQYSSLAAVYVGLRILKHQQDGCGYKSLARPFGNMISGIIQNNASAVTANEITFYSHCKQTRLQMELLIRPPQEIVDINKAREVIYLIDNFLHTVIGALPCLIYTNLATGG